MENMGTVSNYIEIGQLLFGDVKIQYELKDHAVIFYLSREIEGVTYTAEKQYEMFITSHGILLSSDEGDKYFEKYQFNSVATDTWEDVVEDCPSFKS